jgi:prevent-host-death family protein
VQEAKQGFSELIRAVRQEGPQFVTRHGRAVAVVIDIDEYRELKGDKTDFKAFLRGAPGLEVLESARPKDGPRAVKLD